MAFNLSDKDTRQIPIDVFGSLVTQTPPDRLPLGVSPDNGDVSYVPGGVFSRGGLAKQLAPALPSGGSLGLVPTIVYGKSFVQPDKSITNIFIDSNGIIWTEDPINAPGVTTQIGTTTPGSWAKSITAFGREYIAVSDGLHGQEVPLQFDGTNLDRVTQDAPGASPTVANLSYPAVSMANSGSPVVITITDATPEAPDDSGNFTQIIYTTASSTAGLMVGQLLTVATNTGTEMNGTFPITAIYDIGGGNTAVVVSCFVDSSATAGTGGTGTGPAAGNTMTRSANIVTVQTASAHNLKIGYQAQISGVAATSIGSVSTIKIDNEALPGFATVTTAAPHGLFPENFVSIIGVAGVGVGTAISAITWAGGIVTVVTSASHGLSAGAVVGISGATGYNVGAVVVLQIVSDTEFTYAWTPLTAPGAGSAGTVTLNWPVPDTPTPLYYQVATVPSATTFTIPITYCNSTFTTGTVVFAWEGTFFANSIVSSTIFTYQQYGPNASTSQVGTVTPYGQAAPGQHQMCVLYQTRQGAITAPSPPVTFIAAGGQYLSVTNIPLGPPNVVARIIAFTGADGQYFFYIPVQAQINGQIVSTSTVVMDNTTTSVVLDFSDNTLFSALGISIPGNNLANQIVLDSALSFGFYSNRLITHGQRNCIQNLLSMSFDGGQLPSVLDIPCGWSFSDNFGGLQAGHYGQAWGISVPTGGGNSGVLFQSAYQDVYGDPIAFPNTNYDLRVWLQPQASEAGLDFYVTLSSVSTSFTSTAHINGLNMNAAGSWCEANFDTIMPASIPSDMILTLYATNNTGGGLTLVVDEMWIIYSQTPYLETIFYGSYSDNPEAFDGVTGKFGPSQDTRKIMDFGIIRQGFCMLTQDPSGRLHETIDNGTSEPFGWVVNEVGNNCGALSAFSLTKSQADDQSAGGGEQWFFWASSSGVRIFGGSQPWKISQEIQPNWTGQTNPDGSIIPNTGINFSAATTIWAVNDPVSRIVYFGLPIGTATAPKVILTMNYKELDTPEQIYGDAPVKVGFGGKLICTDNTRKWSHWNLAMNSAALMYRGPNLLQLTLFNGNGQSPGLAAGFGNCYTVSSQKLTDDDYGQIFPFYTTAFVPDINAEQGLQLGMGRKVLSYLSAYVAGTGEITITTSCDRLGNHWVNSCTRTLKANPDYDLEYTGGMAQGQRMAFTFASQPSDPTVSLDNGFFLSRVNVAMKIAKRLMVRGSV